MSEMLADLNQTTQPIRPYKVFNNWDVVAKGWYVVCKSEELKRGRAFSKKICGHQIALFRTESGKAHALDAFCPHMGMDLGTGKVSGETLSCHFHHWKFDGAGACVDIPCLEKKTGPQASDDRFAVSSYPTEEKWGYVWVYSDRVAPHPVMDIDDFKGRPTISLRIKPFLRIAHPHITMMNSIDTQHFRTVHRVDIDAEAKITEMGSRFHALFTSKVQKGMLIGRLQNFFLGDTYRSSVLFVDGCIGLLTTMIDIKLFGKYMMPRGHFIFSQTFREKGQTIVYPIVVTERKPGILGFLSSWALLLFHKYLMVFLAWQDGHTIYKSLRFRQDGLLPGIDGPTARWIAFVNRHIEISPWSRAHLARRADAPVAEEAVTG